MKLVLILRKFIILWLIVLCPEEVLFGGFVLRDVSHLGDCRRTDKRTDYLRS